MVSIDTKNIIKPIVKISLFNALTLNWKKKPIAKAKIKNLI